MKLRILSIIFILLCSGTLTLRKNFQAQKCYAPATYKQVKITNAECKGRLLSEYSSLNADKDLVLKQCMDPHHYLDVNNESYEKNISNQCTRKNRFDGTYSYQGFALNTSEENYLNSAKFTGRVVLKEDKYVYDPTPAQGKGFIVATNAPLGEVADIQNDANFNKACGGADKFVHEGKNRLKCFSGNLIVDGAYVKDNTILSFYQNLATHNINYVVMLTNFVEKLKDDANCNCKVKADKYFPINKTNGKYEVFNVKNPDHKTDSGFSVVAEDAGSDDVKAIIGADTFESRSKSVDVRNLTFKKGNNDVHKVVHIHFRGWFDFSVPQGDEEKTLINIVKFIRGKIDSGKNAIVHCTGGIGRTGTFIASVLTTGLQNKKKSFNLVKFILELRKQRPEFVETETQVGLIRRNLN